MLRFKRNKYNSIRKSTYYLESWEILLSYKQEIIRNKPLLESARRCSAIYRKDCMKGRVFNGTR